MLALVALPQAVQAQDPEPPVISFAGANGPRLYSFTRCDGSVELLYDDVQGSVYLDRYRNTSGATTVHVTYGGEPITKLDGSPMPDTYTFDDGEESVGEYFRLAPGADRTKAVTFALEPGDGFVIGDHPTDSATAYDTVQGKNCHDLERTVAVGQAPDPVDLTQYLVEPWGGPPPTIEGDLPPGLRFVEGGRWEGTATTPGTYDFTAVACPFGCVELNFHVVVLSDGTPASTTTAPSPGGPGAAPATPVRGSATFTG